MANQTFHKKANGATVVKDGGKIVTNLPSPSSYAAPTAGPAVPGQRGPVDGDVQSTDITSLFERFNAQNTAPTPPIEELDEQAAELSGKIASLATLGDEAYVRVGDLGLHDLHIWNEESVISKKDAIDLARLNKAIVREARTKLLIEEDEANGITRLSDYGDGDLGTSTAVGTYEINTRDWLLSRAEGIGGSDKIGEFVNGEFVPYSDAGKRSKISRMLSSKTPEAIGRIKNTAPSELAPAGSFDDTAIPIKIGNHLERTIQYEFAVNNPEYQHLEDKSSRVAKGRAYHRFNPDGVLKDQATGEYGIFEAKTSRDSATFERALPGYMAQCLHNAAAADLPFAVLVADVEGEAAQRVIRLDFTPAQRADYRRSLDRVWKFIKPVYDRRMGRFR
jgi:hypothetical protein